MNDSETVALIAGGHAFGKTHGACPAGHGPSPKEDPANPWPGLCGDGKGAHAFTSGFEGPWTPHPTRWDNDYLVQLATRQWEVHKGPGGHWQWRVANGSAPTAPGPQGGKQEAIAPAIGAARGTADGAAAAALLPSLAWQCASTFRLTDYQGGCNGGRVRFAPQTEWPPNAGLERALTLLAPVKARFDAAAAAAGGAARVLSWSDLIVLAGGDTLAPNLPFCPGRTDAADGAGSEYLRFSSTRFDAASTSAVLRAEYASLLGLSLRQLVALTGAAVRASWIASGAAAADAEDNVFFVRLLNETWEATGDA